jgi:hypothetical protein
MAAGSKSPSVFIGSLPTLPTSSRAHIGEMSYPWMGDDWRAASTLNAHVVARPTSEDNESMMVTPMLAAAGPLPADSGE